MEITKSNKIDSSSFYELYKKSQRLLLYLSDEKKKDLVLSWNKNLEIATLLCYEKFGKDNSRTIEKNSIISFTHESIPKVFDHDSVNIVFACSNEFAPYCGIAICSLLNNINLKRNYDIIILDNDSICLENKAGILALGKEYTNVSIRFVNIAEWMKGKAFFTNNYYSKDVYSRVLLASAAFSQYAKIIYLDSDIIVDSDISELFDLDIGNYPLAATEDIMMKYSINLKRNLLYNGTLLSYKYYLKNFLFISDTNKYFNSGVMVFNLELMRKQNFFELLSSKMEIKNYVFLDQCLFNEIFSDAYYKLPYEWNFQCTAFVVTDLEEHLDIYQNEEIQRASKNVKIEHYIGVKKPWMQIDFKESQRFLTYAMETQWFYPIAYASMGKEAEAFIRNSINNQKKKGRRRRE